jgi:hypothetical protein
MAEEAKKSIIKKIALYLYFIITLVSLFLFALQPENKFYLFSILFLVFFFIVVFWIWGVICLVAHFYKIRGEIKDATFALGEIISEISKILLGIMVPIVALLFFLGLLSTLTITTLLIIIIILLLVIIFS